MAGVLTSTASEMFKIEKNIPLRQGGEKRPDHSTDSAEFVDQAGQTREPVKLVTEQELDRKPVNYSSLEGSIPSLDTPKKRGRKPKCRRNTDHVWTSYSADSIKEKCIKCGDRFPCDEPCVHYECLEALGKPLPDWFAIKDVDISTEKDYGDSYGRLRERPHEGDSDGNHDGGARARGVLEGAEGGSESDG